MAEYVTYLDGGLTNGEGLYKYLNRLFSPGIPTQFSTTSLQVSQRGAGANMSVDIAVGDIMLSLPSNAYAFWGYTDAVKNVTITAANPTNPRIDSIVVYVDPTAYTSGSSNNPGALKFISVAGTAAGSPVAPSAGTIQTAIGGSSIAYQILANVAVAANAGQITTSNITDTRTSLTPKFLIKGSNLSNDSSWSWQNYVPPLTNVTVGNGTLVASYTQIGKTVFCRGSLIFGTTTAVTGTVSINLPVAASTTAMFGEVPYNGRGLAYDAGNAIYPTQPEYFTTTAFRLSVTQTQSGANPVNMINNAKVGATIPFTFGVSDAITWNFSYEAA